MRWNKSFSRELHNPVTELIVTLCDEAVHLAVEGMADGEGTAADVAVFGKVWGL